MSRGLGRYPLYRARNPFDHEDDRADMGLAPIGQSLAAYRPEGSILLGIAPEVRLLIFELACDSGRLRPYMRELKYYYPKGYEPQAAYRQLLATCKKIHEEVKTIVLPKMEVLFHDLDTFSQFSKYGRPANFHTFTRHLAFDVGMHHIERLTLGSTGRNFWIELSKLQLSTITFYVSHEEMDKAVVKVPSLFDGHVRGSGRRGCLLKFVGGALVSRLTKSDSDGGVRQVQL